MTPQGKEMMKPNGTIADVERRIAKALACLRSGAVVPAELEGLHYLAGRGSRLAKVQLRRRSDGRKIRSDASSENFDPENAIVEISFDEYDPAMSDDSGNVPLSLDPPLDPHTQDLIESLFELEESDKYGFLALKWIRDRILPGSYPWARKDDGEAQRVIAEAITSGVVIAEKVKNPQAPRFPTTAIRSNRQHPAVAAFVRGESGVSFHPIDIDGKPLSQTVIEERR